MTTSDAEKTTTRLMLAQWLVVHENFPYHVTSTTDNDGVGKHYVKDLANGKEERYQAGLVETPDEAIAAVKRYLEGAK